MPHYRLPPPRRDLDPRGVRLEERVFIRNGAYIYRLDGINRDGTGYNVEWALEDLGLHPDFLDEQIHRARALVVKRALEAREMLNDFRLRLRRAHLWGDIKPWVTGGGKT